MLSEVSFKCTDWAIGVEVLGFPLWRTGFRLRCEESLKSRQSDGLCCCFIPLKRPLTSWQKTVGPSALRSVFRTHYSLFGSGKLWHHFLKDFFSFNPEAKTALSSEKKGLEWCRLIAADWILLFLKSSSLGSIDLVKSAAWLQVKNHLHVTFVLKTPVHFLEALELVNYHHEG